MPGVSNHVRNRVAAASAHEAHGSKHSEGRTRAEQVIANAAAARAEEARRHKEEIKEHYREMDKVMHKGGRRSRKARRSR
jgi:hypothetical protein